VHVIDGGSNPANLDATALANTNDLELHVFGNDANGHTLLVARLDNLGKGASGAAVQNLGLMFGW
jgi:N-acetyl-gamma-glutamyl-phosphate reductase